MENGERRVTDIGGKKMGRGGRTEREVEEKTEGEVMEEGMEINQHARTVPHQVQYIVVSDVLLRSQHFSVTAVTHSAEQHSLT